VTPRDDDILRAIRAMLRARAPQLALDPASITSPSPAVVTVRTVDGALVQVDVTTYRAAELSR
jgi:hypothetical protein